MMQIIIPMSGFGERFRRAGYTVPKPLIEIDGKPVIAHVIDMFPGEQDFIFICNQDHLSNPDYRMEDILRQSMDFQGVNSRFNGGMLLFRLHKFRRIFAF